MNHQNTDPETARHLDRPSPYRSPTPYAFEKLLKDSGGTEPARLEAQNRLFEQQGPLDLIPPLPENGRILDVGSGMGFWAVRLAAKVPHGQMVCLDRSPELLEHARARLEQVGLKGTEFLQQDLRDLDLPADSFDLVFTCMTLAHVMELEEALRCLTRALKPGGWIVCFEPIQEGHGLFDVYPPCEDLLFLADQIVGVCRDQGTDLSVGLKIANLLDHLGLEDTALRYFGSAPHGEALRAWVEDIFLPIVKTYLGSRFQPEYLERRLGLALEQSRRPGTWIDLKRTAVLGRKPRIR